MGSSYALRCVLLATTTFASVGRAAASGGEVLQPGAAVRRHLAPAEAQAFVFDASAGDLVDVTVQPRGVDVLLSLTDPSGAVVLKVDRSINPMWPERLLWIAASVGTHSVSVQAKAERPGGAYEVVLGPVRRALPEDQRRVAAERDLEQVLRWWKAGTWATPDISGQARARLDAALEALRATGDRRGEAEVHRLGGELELALNRRKEAITSGERALAVYRELADGDGQAVALQIMGWARFHLGETEAALDHYRAALQFTRQTSNDWVEATYLTDVGTIHRRTGAAERAIESFEQAIARARASGNREVEAFAFNNLGIAYKDLGEYEKALSAYQHAVEVFDVLKDARGRAGTFNNMGNVYRQMGEDARARELYLRYLDHARSESPGGATEARALNNLSGIAHRLGDYVEALAQGRRSLEIRTKLGDVSGQAATLHSLGQTLHATGQAGEALASLKEALRIRRELGERYLESDTLLEIAVVERDRGNLREALAQAEAAVTLTEELRAAVTSPELRASFVAAQQDKYGVYIDILMRLHEQDAAGGHAAAALAASERARARVLLDTLVEARADIREGVEPALLERERALQKRLSDASARLSAALTRKGTAEAIAEGKRELATLVEEYRQIEARIRQESPRYAALTQPVPATVEEIRRELLDEDTVLLAFHLGEERSFSWALTRAELVTHALPGRVQIETAARKVHELSTARQRTRSPGAAADSDRRLEAESAALATMLLGPLDARLRGDWRAKRLLVVASGALAYVPWSALPAPSERPANRLIRDHELVFAPSASALIAMRQERAPVAAPALSVAVLADPVFETSDPRVSSRARGARDSPLPGTATGLRRAIDNRGGHGFARLPFSRREAEAIALLVPSARLLKATDFAANRALVTGGALGPRTVVHFATHGLLDSEHPDLSGLVLSLVDESGAPQDGFVRMHEVYNLRLPADLVVLSACQTALGREIRGEGLVGLTRGFMYAGAKAVVASLWQVDDESTAELMKRFYRGLLKEDRRPADALRQAQLELSRDKRWSAPFHWAGFVLQGDWR